MNMDRHQQAHTPSLDGSLRSHYIRMPEQCQEASGIRVLGRNIKTIVYSTDIAIIRNCDADAVWAVYPFTPQQAISDAIIKASSIPVFVGVDGGTTAGPRSAVMASDAETTGANSVICVPPSNRELLSEMMTNYRDSSHALKNEESTRAFSNAASEEILGHLQMLSEQSRWQSASTVSAS